MTPTPARTSSRLDGAAVLIIDDDEDLLMLLRAILEDAGARVETAQAPTDALDKLKRVRPDVVVSDIGMPRVDGYELMRRIRSLPPRDGGATPAIALTAYTRKEDVQRAKDVGFQLHVTKPIEPTDLVAAVVSLWKSL